MTTYYAQMDSPIGALRLLSDGVAITGLDMLDGDAPPPSALASADGGSQARSAESAAPPYTGRRVALKTASAGAGGAVP